MQDPALGQFTPERVNKKSLQTKISHSCKPFFWHRQKVRDRTLKNYPIQSLVIIYTTAPPIRFLSHNHIFLIIRGIGWILYTNEKLPALPVILSSWLTSPKKKLFFLSSTNPLPLSNVSLKAERKQIYQPIWSCKHPLRVNIFPPCPRLDLFNFLPDHTKQIDRVTTMIKLVIEKNIWSGHHGRM